MVKTGSRHRAEKILPVSRMKHSLQASGSFFNGAACLEPGITAALEIKKKRGPKPPAGIHFMG